MCVFFDSEKGLCSLVSEKCVQCANGLMLFEEIDILNGDELQIKD